MKESVVLYFRGYPHTQHQDSSDKVKLLKKNWQVDLIEVFIDNMAVEHLSHLIDKAKDYDTVVLIGESMGCLSAMYMNSIITNNYKRIILLNPSYYPEETLKDALSADELKRTLEIKSLLETKNQPNEMYVFQCLDDERVDFEHFNKRWDDKIAFITQLESGGHRMTTFSVIYEQITFISFGQYCDIDDFGASSMIFSTMLSQEQMLIDAEEIDLMTTDKNN